MWKDFNIGTQSIFSCKGEKFDIGMESRACFMPIHFYKYEGDLEYKLRMYRKRIDNKYVRNFCSCSDQEIIEHINFIKNFSSKDRDISISENIEEVGPGLSEITLRVTGPNKWHRLVLIWARYLFEDPFQYITKEAHQFSRETGIDLFLSEQICFRAYRSTGNHNHTLYGRDLFEIIKTPTFLEKFNSLKSVVQEGDTWGGTEDNPSLQSIWSFDETELKGFEMDLYKERSKSNWIKRKEIYERVKESVA